MNLASLPFAELGGDVQPRTFFDILGLIIVELVDGSHLAGNRCFGMLIAQHGALDLPRIHAALHQNFGVVITGQMQRLGQLVPRADLADAHRRAQIRRLHEDGKTKPLAKRILHLRGVLLPLAPPHHQPGDHREACLAEQPLHHVLVHPRRRPQHSRAHIGNSRQFQQPLNRPVLPKGAVQYGKDNIQFVRLSGTRIQRNQPLDTGFGGKHNRLPVPDAAGQQLFRTFAQ